MSFGIYLLFALISFGASIIGAICGIGGGIIIKPVLDAAGVLSVSTISFLSGCTVLAMTGYSVLRAKLSGSSGIEARTATPLALGAAFGGIGGKAMFERVSALFAAPDTVGAVQAFCLMLITFGTLVYTLKKERIRTLRLRSMAVCALIGFLLGLISSFLGIGGGPINLVVLFYFFSMDTKRAAQNSLYIILFSQAASLLSSLLTGTVPDFPAALLLLMIACGIGGGICGRAVNKKIDEKAVDQLFIGLMVVIILINLYNIVRFL